MVTKLSAEAGSKPSVGFWYAIPHGYISLDLNPSVENVETLVEQVLHMSDHMRDRAQQVLRFYAGVVTSLNMQDVLGCAMGLHPDEAGGVTSSVFTISTFPATGSNSKALLANMAGMADDPADSGMRPMELPCGLGFMSEEKRRVPVPDSPANDSEEPPAHAVWQGTVMVPDSSGSDIIVVQLVTPALELADDYRNVLLGIAHTLTFTDPSLPEETTDTKVANPGSVAAAVQNDFG